LDFRVSSISDSSISEHVLKLKNTFTKLF